MGSVSWASFLHMVDGECIVGAVIEGAHEASL